MRSISISKQIYESLVDVYQVLNSVYQICYPDFEEFVQEQLKPNYASKLCMEFAKDIINAKYFLIMYKYFESLKFLEIEIEKGDVKLTKKFEEVSINDLLNILATLYNLKEPTLERLRLIIERNLAIKEPFEFTFDQLVKSLIV